MVAMVAEIVLCDLDVVVLVCFLSVTGTDLLVFEDQLCDGVLLSVLLSGSSTDAGDEHDHRLPSSPSAHCHPGPRR